MKFIAGLCPDCTRPIDHNPEDPGWGFELREWYVTAGSIPSLPLETEAQYNARVDAALDSVFAAAQSASATPPSPGGAPISGVISGPEGYPQISGHYYNSFGAAPDGFAHPPRSELASRPDLYGQPRSRIQCEYRFVFRVPGTPGRYLRIDWDVVERPYNSGDVPTVIESLSFVWDGVVPGGYDRDAQATWPHSPTYGLAVSVLNMTRAVGLSGFQPKISCYPIKAPSGWRTVEDQMSVELRWWDQDDDAVEGTGAPVPSSNGGTSTSTAPTGGGLVTPVGGSGPLGGTAGGGLNGPSGPVQNGGIGGTGSLGGGSASGSLGGAGSLGGGSASGSFGFNPAGGGLGLGGKPSGLGSNPAGGGLGNGGSLGGGSASGSLGFNPTGGGLGNGGKPSGLGYNPGGGGLGKQPDPYDRNTVPKTNPLDAERARLEREKNAARNRPWPTPTGPKKYPPRRIIIPPADNAPYWKGLLWQEFITVSGTTVRLAVDFVSLPGTFPYTPADARTRNEVAIWFSNRGVVLNDVKIIRDGVLVASTLVGSDPANNVQLWDPALAGFNLLPETEVVFYNPFNDVHRIGGLRLLQSLSLL